MGQMKLGVKVVIALGTIGAVLTTVALYVIGQQEQVRLLALLEEQGKVIQAQIEVTRAYVAKNYVGKVKTSSVGSEITVAREHALDPQAIPFPATATQEIGKMLGERGIFQARLISDQPMNQANAPHDEFEKKAMQAILSGADAYSVSYTHLTLPTNREV